MKKNFLSNVTFTNIFRWWLTGFLIVLPFQHKIVRAIEWWNYEIASLISYLDEITIVIFFPLAIRKFYQKREVPDRLYVFLLLPFILLPILVMSTSGFISGMVNGNSLFITILGIFDYIKNFLVIFIFAAFFKEFSKFKKILSLLLIVAVFIGAIALIQELWAMYSRYIVGKGIRDISYILTKNTLPEGSWRFGIYRAPSITHNPIIMGLYCLLILTIYTYTVKKINFAVLIPLLSGVLISVSRMVYTGFMFITGVQILRARRLLMALLIPFVILFFFLTLKLEPVNVVEMSEQATGGKYVVSFREYTRDKAMEIWRDHPFWGVGPGMFGGVISVRYQSPVYDEYNFVKDVKKLIFRWKSIDQFWPHLLAETGILGTVSFAGFLISLFISLLILRQRATSDEIRDLITGLLTFTIVIPIYLLGMGLNITSILFTYSAFVGMGLGCAAE